MARLAEAHPGMMLQPAKMAVELAKVSLWLHSFTVGAPLSFLDHHLRCGNSVLGGWVRPTMDWLQARGSLIANNHLAPLANVVRHMETIEGLTDTDLTEVHQSKQLFGTVNQRAADERAQAWRPWRAYAVLRLWNSLEKTA